jgi:RNA polymerase sigma factor (sigma-70 family)
MGGIENHDKTGSKVLSFDDKEYLHGAHPSNIDELYDLFDQLGSDPKINVDTIVAKTSELLKTCCSLYNRLEQQGKSLNAWAASNLPLEFDREHIPDGRICYEETIRGKDQPVSIEDIGKTPYAQTDQSFTKCGLKSYLGFPISSESKTIGSLCAMDDKIRKFRPEELQIIVILAKVLSLEESRLVDRDELERLRNEIRDHHRQLADLVEQHKTTYSRLNKQLREEKEAHRQTLALIKTKAEELAEKDEELERINSALTVLSKKKDQEINELEDCLLCNVQKLVDPVINNLRASGLSSLQKKWLSVLVSTLNEITSPLSKRLSSVYYSLTPSEIKVAGYIEIDKTNKEIAELLGISCRTVEVHRSNIRKKLGIKKRNVNLRTHLLSLK